MPYSYTYLSLAMFTFLSVSLLLSELSIVYINAQYNTSIFPVITDLEQSLTNGNTLMNDGNVNNKCQHRWC